MIKLSNLYKTDRKDIRYHILNYCRKHNFDNKAYDIIFKKYNEKHRYYHNLKHISNMLTNLELFKESEMYPEINYIPIEIAILFHDIIYDVVKSSDITLPYEFNEELSVAEYFKAQEKNNFNIDSNNKYIMELILSTKHSTYSNSFIRNDLEFKILRDCDFLHFGMDSFEEYHKIQKNIYKEYLGEDYINKLHFMYVDARISWLQSISFKNQCKFFETDFAIKNFKENAFNNMEQEIKWLKENEV